MLVALTRSVSPRFNECELTHFDRVPIDVDLARDQHRSYEAALEGLGVRVVRLQEEPDLPDSVFVEDAAIVVDEFALITRMGAPSRWGESQSVEQALQPYRRMVRIEEPGTVDGGDVLRLGKTLYVGLSTRSNESAILQMRAALGSQGYEVRQVPIQECLHLKSAVTQVSSDTLLLNPAWVDPSHFSGRKYIEVSPDEPGAANAVFLPQGTIYPSHFPATKARLEKERIPLRLVDATEVAKAEGAVTCCSIVFEVNVAP